MSSDQNLFQIWYSAITDELRKSGELDNISSDFGILKSDEERITFAWNFPVIHRVIQVDPTFEGKSAEQSLALRNQGNTLFQKKLFNQAVFLYTESVLKAPRTSEGRELALAFANRSAAFFQLKDYNSCLQDIEWALYFGYPEELQYKLLERRGKCLDQLGKQQEAVKYLEEAKRYIHFSKLDEKTKIVLEKNLENEIKLANSRQIKFSSHQDNFSTKLEVNFKSLSLADERNKVYISASKAVRVSYNLKSGRYLVANRDIMVGETLVVDTAFASVLLPDIRTQCHHCYKWITAVLPCSQCSKVRYCSLLCAKQSWNCYHSVECKYLDLIHAAGIGCMAHLALRVVIKAGLKFLREFKQSIEPKGKSKKDPVLSGCNENGVYDPSDYSTIYHLVTHSSDRSISDMFHRTVIAVFLLKCLEGGGFFQIQGETVSQSERVFIGSLILRHLQNLPCNAHEVSNLELDLLSVGTSQTREIAAAIYATMSLFNHSCDPDVTRNFYGDICVMRSIKNIPAGKEIVDNYGTLYAVEPKIQRKVRLQEQYYFDCCCEACENSWPLYEDLVTQSSPVFRCEVCRSPLKACDASKMLKCSHCGKSHDIQSKVLLLEKSQEKYLKAMNDLLEYADVKVALPALTTELRLIENLVCAPWKDINNCQEALKQCYNIMGNCHVLKN